MAGGGEWETGSGGVKGATHPTTHPRHKRHFDPAIVRVKWMVLHL